MIRLEVSAPMVEFAHPPLFPVIEIPLGNEPKPATDKAPTVPIAPAAFIVSAAPRVLL